MKGSELLKEAIDKLLSLAAPTIIEDKEKPSRCYSDRTLHPIQPPIPSPVNVCTLAGFLDLVSAHIENYSTDVLVHVVDHEEVQLIAKISDDWARRVVYAKAELIETTGFPFGQFLNHEQFVIGVSSCFTSAADRDYLLKVASNISTERVGTSADDGISQQVGMKAGVVLKSTEILKSRVSLAPYRTFREVEQPSSEFILRVKQGAEGVVPTLALFEADGGNWKIAAIENVARYLRPAVKDIPVIS
jgi:hypothetical protein